MSAAMRQRAALFAALLTVGGWTAAADSLAPALSLPDLEGTAHQLEDWRGSVLVVNFWASWCPPCVTEIPTLVRLQNQYADQGLVVVGVGVDEPRPLGNVRRSLGINYPVLVLDEAEATPTLSAWGNNDGFIPYSVVVDRDGKVRYKHRGILDVETFDEEVLPLLKAPAADKT